jgi:hypothetical protein
LTKKGFAPMISFYKPVWSAIWGRASRERRKDFGLSGGSLLETFACRNSFKDFLRNA